MIELESFQSSEFLDELSKVDKNSVLHAVILDDSGMFNAFKSSGLVFEHAIVSRLVSEKIENVNVSYVDITLAIKELVISSDGFYAFRDIQGVKQGKNEPEIYNQLKRVYENALKISNEQ